MARRSRRLDLRQPQAVRRERGSDAAIRAASATDAQMLEKADCVILWAPMRPRRCTPTGFATTVSVSPACRRVLEGANRGRGISMASPPWCSSSSTRWHPTSRCSARRIGSSSPSMQADGSRSRSGDRDRRRADRARRSGFGAVLAQRLPRRRDELKRRRALCRARWARRRRRSVKWSSRRGHRARGRLRRGSSEAGFSRTSTM